MKKNRLFFFGYAFFCVLFIFTVLEIGARVILRDRYNRDERNLCYAYDPVLGWFPEKNSQNIFKSTKDILVHHNSRGFRDKEIDADKRHARVAFLGDSFVWGYDVAAEERFTEKLRGRLGDAEVINMGISGFSTDQELLLLMREWNYVKPDFVFLMVCGNDRSGNSSNMEYGYYKPYFLLKDDRVRLQGIPVPKNAMYCLKDLGYGLNHSSLAMMVLKIIENLKEGRHFSHSKLQVPDPTAALIEEMNIFLHKKQVGFAVAMVDADEPLARFCRTQGIPVLDLAFDGETFRFLSNGRHWNEKGNARVAELVQQFLKNATVF